MPININDFGDKLLVKAALRLSERIKTIDRNQRLISNGRGVLAETKSRLQQFSQRLKKLQEEEAHFTEKTGDSIHVSEIGLERKIGKTNDLLSIEFFESGLLAAKSVGRLNVLFGDSYGTGFHVGHQIIMTNHHVLEDSNQANGCEFDLNVEENRIGSAKKVYTYVLEPERFFLTDKELDFTLVAVGDPFGSNPPLDHFGWHVLLEMQGKIRIGDPVNIIQHPNGGTKAIAVHNSHFLYLENGTQDEQFCWYSGDTEKGSSGAPVFNNRWEVIALHHKAIPKTNVNGDIVDRNGHVMSKDRATESPDDIAWVANEGIRASRLVKAIKQASISDPVQSKIRDELIALWNVPGAQKRGRKSAEQA